MPAFEFIEDAKSPNRFGAGEFTPHADQSRFVSIWGMIDGEGYFKNGHEIQQGIYSADGAARLRGEEYKDANGKTHDIKHRKATLREYIVPRDAVVSWNAYEAAQGNRKEAEFRATHDAKMRAFGLRPESSDIQEDLIEVRSPEGDQGASTSTTVSMHVAAPRRRGRPPKQPVS